MTDDANNELQEAVAGIRSAQDVVDLLVVLLGICRRHPRDVVAAGQDQEKQKRRARLANAAAKTFTSIGLSDRTRNFAINALQRGANIAETARALAIGVDMAVQDRDPKAYSKSCAKWGRRELQEGDPYPTPLVDLDAMYGPGRGFSRRPYYSKAGTAFDRVDGLALWPSSSSRPLHVIYDTLAGAHLDNALSGQTVDILTVSPNGDLGEFDWSGISADQKRVFGVRPLNTARQDAIVEDALREAADHGADIVVTPELSCTTRTVGLICKKLAGAGDRRPRIVIAGGSHIRVDGKRRNRLSTIYTDPSPYVVTHDKIGRYAFSVPGGAPGTECVEDISRSTELRMHAGVNWSMIPLICADFLDDEVVDAVADLCPRLVVVPSMSSKTGDFERRADEVISKTQALVVVVNAPHNWFFTKVPVVVIGLPLADPEKGIIKQSPAPQAKPPYMVLFRSGKRSAGFI